NGYGLYLETTVRTGFALGSDDSSAFRFYAAEPRLRYRVFVHDDPKDTLNAYTAVAGRAPLPAPWVFGPRRRVDPGNMANGMPEEQALRTFRVPTTMVDDTRHFLPVGSEVGMETQLAAWTSHVHDLGYKAIGYFNPYVSVDNPNVAD